MMLKKAKTIIGVVVGKAELSLFAIAAIVGVKRWPTMLSSLKQFFFVVAN